MAATYASKQPDPRDQLPLDGAVRRVRFAVWLLVLVAAASCLAPRSVCVAAEPPQVYTPSPGFQRFVSDLVRSHIPHSFEDTKNWGRTKKAFAGFHIHREGLKIETRRKWKQANHGSWKRYRVTLVDPQRSFDVRLENMTETRDGRVAFDVRVTAHVLLFGRVSKWHKGVQLYSFGADAEARVQLRARCLVRLDWNPTRFPPVVALKPRVATADLELTEFKLRRLSDLSGTLALNLGKGFRGMLEKKVAAQRAKLAEKLNRQLVKVEPKLTFSLEEVVRSKLLDAMVGKSAGEGDGEQAGTRLLERLTSPRASSAAPPATTPPSLDPPRSD